MPNSNQDLLRRADERLTRSESQIYPVSVPHSTEFGRLESLWLAFGKGAATVGKGAATVGKESATVGKESAAGGPAR